MSIKRVLGTTTAGFGANGIDTAFPLLQQYSIQCVEMFCTDAADASWRREGYAQEVVEAAKQYGLTLWSCHAPFGETDLSAVDESRRRASIDTDIAVLDFAKAIGAGTVVVHAGTEPPEDVDRNPLMLQSLRSLNELAKRASQRGLKLALETLPRTCLGNRIAEIKWMLEQVDGDLGVCYDINHVGLYEDVPQTVRALGEAIITVHLSDHDGQERHWLPGLGITDWRAFVSTLDEIGYTGPLMHEAFAASGDLPESFAAISGFWAELGVCPTTTSAA